MANSLSHTKLMCKYHIVFIPKYRRKVIYHKLRADIQGYIRDLFKWKGVEIIEGHMMPDHIHLLVDCKPQLRLSDAIKILKGNTARWLFLKHPEIKETLWGGHLWNPSYFVSTVNDRTLEQVQKYINNQKKL